MPFAARGLGLAHQTGRDRLTFSLGVDVLLDLDCAEFGLGHLPVEELHDAAELGRDLTRSRAAGTDPITAMQGQTMDEASARGLTQNVSR